MQSRFRFAGLLAGLMAWALLAPISATHAQEPRWVALGPFARVDGLTADPRLLGVVYANSGRGSVSRSASGGVSWTVITSPNRNWNATGRVAVDPVDSRLLYLPASSQVDGLVKSVDGGAHWVQSTRGLPIERRGKIVVVDPARRSRLYLALAQGLFRSLDGGASWTPATSGLGSNLVITALAAVSRPAGTAFAGTRGGLYRTRDGGVSWQRLGLPVALVTALAAAPSDPQTLYVSLQGKGVFRTSDGGASWQTAGALPRGVGDVALLAVHPQSARILYTSVDGNVIFRSTIFRSTDRGRQWSAIGQVPGPVQALLVDPAVPRILYAGTADPSTGLGGVFRSEDGGATWASRNQGLAAPWTFSFAVDPGDPDELWVAPESGSLLHSTNRGLDWTSVPLPTGNPTSSRPYIEDIAAIPGGAVVRAAVSVGNGQGGFALLKTDDGGASWTQILGPPSVYVGVFQIAPSLPSTLYELGSTGFVRSIDGGASWQVRLEGLSPIEYIYGFTVTPSAPAVLYLTGFNPQVLRSTDGGASWTNRSAGLPGLYTIGFAVDPLDPDLLYAGPQSFSPAQGHGVWKSRDGGATWGRVGQALRNQIVSALAASSIPGRLYAAVAGRILRSTDGGVSWADRSGGLQSFETRELSIDPSDPERVYAATLNGLWALEDGP
ncbi:MAG TPA: YCF48-related protein [Thermoanaerobaculia bacterium]|nr:YCF48-related protein [Thermoanaerobaculia bacterium]